MEKMIRIYVGDRTISEVWGSIIHEVLHGIADERQLTIDDVYHNEIDIFCCELATTLFEELDWKKFSENKPVKYEIRKVKKIQL
jgi:hypothetical protein